MSSGSSLVSWPRSSRRRRWRRVWRSTDPPLGAGSRPRSRELASPIRRVRSRWSASSARRACRSTRGRGATRSRSSPAIRSWRPAAVPVPSCARAMARCPKASVRHRVAQPEQPVPPGAPRELPERRRLSPACGAADGRRRLGGDIMIHGNAVSIGCLAMGDVVAEELVRAGRRHRAAGDRPSCSRRTTCAANRRQWPGLPAWAPALYADVAAALCPASGGPLRGRQFVKSTVVASIRSVCCGACASPVSPSWLS